VKHLKKLMIFIAALFAVATAEQAGAIEHIVDTADAARIKNEVVSAMLDADFTLTEDTQYKLVFGKQVNLDPGSGAPYPGMVSVSFTVVPQSDKTRLSVFCVVTSHYDFIATRNQKNYDAWLDKFFRRLTAKIEKDTFIERASNAESVINQIQMPGGVAEVTRQLIEARRKDPDAQLFPEITVSTIGQDYMRTDKPKLAVDVLKLVLLAYPESADANETFAEAYLADAQKELARQHAEKALALLDSHRLPSSSWTDTEQYRGEIRRGAEKLLKQLTPRS
jgi:hypothetical protein